MELSKPFEAGDPERVGPYRIVGRLGEGGMGRVYLGLSRSGRKFAVKVVRPELSEDPSFRQRFAREVAAARAVSGAFTAPVVDADVEGSPAWLATSYVRGQSLADAVAAHGGWPEGPLLVLAAGLAEALESIHRTGVVHRDLKPSNVLLGPDGPLVIDFGISLVGGATALTTAGVVVGTVGFMSPEQLTGRPVGTASDVFSLGAVVTLAAGGNAPFGTGSAPEVMFRSVYEEPDVSSVPSRLRDVVTRCLAKDPEQRPTVGALLDELAAMAERAGGIADWRAFVAGVSGSGTPRPVPTVVTPQQAPSLPVDEAVTQTAPRRVAPGQAVTPAPAEPAAGLETQTVLLGGARSDPARRQVLSVLAGVGAAAGLGGGGWALLSSGSHNRGGPAAPDRKIWAAGTNGAVPLGLAVTGGVVYVNDFDGYLTAWDTATGKKLWACRIGISGDSETNVGPAEATPAVAGGLVYVGSTDQMLYAIDADSGKRRWTGGPVGRAASPVVSGDMVFAHGDDSPVFSAWHASNGEKRWEFVADYDEKISTLTPAVSGDTVYIGTDAGHLYALNIRNGHQRWKFDAGTMPIASPAVSGGTVFASNDRKLFALAAESGRPRWTLATGGTSPWSPALSAGYLYLSSEHAHLHALQAADGKERWKTSVTKGTILATPTVARGVVYLGTEDLDFNVYAVDAANGHLRWKYHTGSYVVTRPVVVGRVVYIGSADGHVYALRA
ncbi:PQQ-binding-like beta-propeller repeat protein [Streptomyces sp. NBC_00076]|uniref:outer membrane protein assembly factor BamB family protein n=1 Tax=Streptomyces sp. NBC_00076 TaxID=2975642 RepID=UPI00324E373E